MSAKKRDKTRRKFSSAPHIQASSAYEQGCHHFAMQIQSRKRIRASTDQLREQARATLQKSLPVAIESFVLGYRDAENDYLRTVFGMSVKLIEDTGLPSTSTKHEVVVAWSYINW